MAALLGVARGAVAAPRRPALVKPSRRLLHSNSLSQKAAQKPELARVETLGHSSHVSSNRTDGPSGSPRGGGIVRSAHRRSNNETPGSSKKLGSGRRSAGKATAVRARPRCRGAPRPSLLRSTSRTSSELARAAREGQPSQQAEAQRRATRRATAQSLSEWP